MNCPTDNAPLVMSERSGIEIDYCPQCRGVWLDRGELDKIIERSATEYARPATPPEAPPRYEQAAPRYEQPRYPGGQGYSKPRKRENWLSELFD